MNHEGRRSSGSMYLYFGPPSITVRRTRRKREELHFKIFGFPENFPIPSDFVYVSSRNIPPSSAQFFLRHRQIFSTSLRAHYVTSTYVFHNFLRHRTPNLQTPNRALLFPFRVRVRVRVRVGIRVRVRVRVFPEH